MSFGLKVRTTGSIPHLHEAGRLMKDLAQKNSDLIKGDFGKNLSKSALRYRALNQAARELLLAEVQRLAIYHEGRNDGGLRPKEIEGAFKPVL